MEVVKISGGPPSVEVTAGLSAREGRAGATVGGAGVIGPGDRFAVEATSAWLDRGRATTTVAASANLRIVLNPSDERLTPYAVAGAGLVYARFDMDMMMAGLAGRVDAGTMLQPLGGNQGGFGTMGSGYFGGGMGMSAGFGPGTGSYFGTFTQANLPDFYAARMGAMRVPADGRCGSRSFTNPAVTLGGGVRVSVTDRFFVRPDARAGRDRQRPHPHARPVLAGAGCVVLGSVSRKP